MDVNTRNRADLKAFFVKNSIPTQSNFADLIDGMLNQKDDGFVKAKNLPLSIEAADPGIADSEKRAIAIYQSFADPNPAWTLSLNPRMTPNDPQTAKAGFSISDGEGTSRLFIDRNSGHIGIGTMTPGAKLEINATSSTHGGWLEAIRFTRAEHSAITHPGGGLLFGMHSDRKFYFTDIKGGFRKHVLAIDAESGKIISPLWKTTRLFDRKAGPLPVEATFTSSGGTLVVFTSGTAFKGAAGMMSLQLTMDGKNDRFVDCFTNEGSSHKACPTTVEVFTGMAAGNHTFKIAVFGGTAVTDLNDRFYATVLELPF